MLSFQSNLQQNRIRNLCVPQSNRQGTRKYHAWKYLFDKHYANIVCITYKKNVIISILQTSNIWQFAGANAATMLLFCAFSLAVSWIYLPREVSCSTREYFIAAVERNWDYAPSGQNKIKGIPLINDRYCEIQLWSNACIWEKSLVWSILLYTSNR